MVAFPDGVPWSLQPSDPVHTVNAGPLQARISQASSHIQLVGPDLAGAALANTIVLAPPAILTQNGAAVFGEVVSSTAIADGLALEQVVAGTHVKADLRFTHEGVLHYEVVDWGGLTPQQTAIAGAVAAREHFFGFGEKFDSLDQTGKRVDILTFDDPGTKRDHSYKVAPWFVSTRGYGFHLDSTAESTFDMASGANGRFVVTNPFSSLRLNLVYGPRLADVLSRYTGYMGRPPLPPPWAFGPWISSDIWPTGGEVRYAVTQFRDHGIPASGFVFDSPWEIAYNDFQFNMTQFGQDATIEKVHYPGFVSLAEMMEFLRRNGLKVICWMTPLVNTESGDEHVAGQNLGQAANYADGAAKQAFVRSSPAGPPLVVPWWKGKGSPIDFTNPVAQDWLRAQLESLLAASQVATASGDSEPAIGGFKTDDGESGNGTNTYIPATAAYADGRRGVEMRNGYCAEYHKAIWNVLGKTGVLFARSGFAGSHAFPGYWAGDNEPNFGDNGLPSVIVAGQSAAMSGYSIWGHDVGGYQDTNPSLSPPNLFMRWAQFGCFSPLMQMHRQVTSGRQYPWRFGDAALANYVFFTRLHVRLFPYIYTYAQQASTSGLPIIRPLVLLDQEDPNTVAVNHTYHFGNEFLVAPVLTPNATTRDVYLPRGTWLDFWSHATHQGGKTITWRNADQAQMPLFVREGAIVPQLPSDVRTLCDANYLNEPTITTRTDDLLVEVYPGADSQFTVFDGTQVQCHGDQTTGSVTLTATPRALTVRILGQKPNAVTKDGSAVPEQAPVAGTTSWQYDNTTGFIELRFSHAGGSSTITY